jgi:dolichol kinase
MTQINEMYTADKPAEFKTRKDLQLARRFFHMMNGVVIATVYNLLLTHNQAVYILGSMACLLYVFEQIRISYPELSTKFVFFIKLIIRAEERLKESAMVPYAFSLLLTIITFPKPIAVTAIYVLAIADPLSAIVGIKFGKNKIAGHKSLEGSAAFFVATFLITFSVFSIEYYGLMGEIFFLSLFLAFFVSLFELIPLKLDDNLTIPLTTAVLGWVICEILGIPTIAVF